TDEEVLRYGASLEQQSEHPIAVGLVKTAEEKNLKLDQITDFKSITGKGIEGNIGSKKINVVSPGYVNNMDMTYNTEKFDQMSVEGKTVVFVLVDDELIGMIALADIIRESAKEAVASLKEKGVHSVMLTGDNERVAHWVAKQLGIDEVYAEVLPDHKADKVKEIQAKGWKVA